MDVTIQEKVQIFRAFSDEKRLLILQELQTGEKCACDLITVAKICQSSLSYQMGILTRSGIVEQRVEGKWIYYRISKEGSAYALSLLQTITHISDKPQKEHTHCFESESCCAENVHLK